MHKFYIDISDKQIADLYVNLHLIYIKWSKEMKAKRRFVSFMKYCNE